MKVTAEATEQITEINGVPCRVWKATTGAGVEFFMFVHRVAVDPGADASEFERALQEVPAPEPVPLHQVFDAPTSYRG